MITRLSGGLTPANGADPRTFPAIWNATAVDIEAVEADVTVLQSDVDVVEGSAVALGSAVTVLQGSAVALGSAIDVIEAWDLDDLNDVTIGTAVADGQVLAYSTAVSGWVNQDAAGGGKILQVINVTYGTEATKTGTLTFGDTGLSATITPTSATSKIFVIVNQTGIYKTAADIVVQIRLLRNSTSLIEFENVAAGNGGAGANYVGGSGASYLDAPSTTSAVTYKTQYRANGTGGTIGVQVGNSVSTITLMEVAA